MRQEELRQGELRQGELRQGELRQGELRQGELRQGELRQGELRQGGDGMRKAILLLGLIITALIAGCSNGEQVTILHLNDAHSWYLPYQKEGGAARWATIIGQIRKTNPNLLLISAGDEMTGTVLTTVFGGQISIEALNRLGYNYMAVGNHEFDLGTNELYGMTKTAKFPIMSANIFDAKTGKRLYTDYKITNISGKKIVLIAVTTSDMGAIAREPASILKIYPAAVVLSNYVYTMKLLQTNDAAILISHSGFEEDVAIAQSLPDAFDVIIGGHTHTLVSTPRRIGKTMIVQAGSYGVYIGKINLTFRGGKIAEKDYELIKVSSNIASEPQMEAFLSNRNQELKAKMDIPICESLVSLDNSGLRQMSIPLANYIADLTAGISKADIAVINAGSIRAPIAQGTVMLRNLFELSPYENTLVIVPITGKQLKAAAVKGISKRNTGGFLCYSKGIEVRVKDEKNIEVLYNGKVVKDEDKFTVATSDFMYQAGDGYTELGDGKGGIETGINIRDAIVKQLKAVGKIESKSVDMKPRVVFLEQ